MTKLNKVLMASTAIAFATGLAIPASAQDPAAAPGVVSSQKKVKIRLYGQISRMFGIVGDGETTTFKQGENGNSSTRMGIDGRGKITNDISLRTRMEYAVQSGDNDGGSQFENQGGSANRFTIRHLDVILSSKKFGAVWIGRGDTATNGSSEVSLAPGISSAHLGGTLTNLGGSYHVLDDDEDLAVRDRGEVGSFFDSFDGAGRQNRIRYDTPTFFGFKAAASIIDKHNYDVALWYKGKIAGTELAGAAGFCHTEGSESAGDGACWGNGTTINGITQFNGSVSVLTPIGLGATFSGAHQRRELQGAGHSAFNDTTYNLQPSIWYTMKATELGATTFEYAFQYCKECGEMDTKGMAHALNVVQRIDSVGGDYFVTARYYDVEDTAGDDIDGLWFVGGGFIQRF
ncbi:MAG: porin [Alphaproteobacteria bacterium]|nr:porin [Alphaproteobacteria bacterium]